MGKIGIPFIIGISVLLSAYSGQSLIIGDWKPLKGQTGCGDRITFTKESTFQLTVEDKKIIEGTYKKIDDQKFLLEFFNGYKAEARIIFDNQRLILKIGDKEGERCLSIKYH